MISLRRIGGDDPGAFLHVVSCDDGVVVMQNDVVADWRKVGHAGIGFKAAAKII